ncbi:MAG: glycosyltransferase [Myxococcales bacterium]|nr:glycosyltransferase [Myxococcales bacterium]
MISTVLLSLYALAALGLAIYGGYFVWMATLPPANSDRPTPSPPEDDALPTVTVQLPMFNESRVAARVIDAVCRMRYPRAKLQVQVLDDSTDGSSEAVAARVAHWRARGLAIEHIRRASRDRFKAGALAHGLETASGELIAIFDADFVPAPEWLRHTAAWFCAAGSDELGLVQTRWGHLNAERSALTRTQARILDDFADQQALRAAAGLLVLFNGTAGLWRRACIDDAGGWSGRTLSEDFDLSLRAHMSGWTVAFDDAARAAAELPETVAAYRSQQRRWAKGNLQATRCLGPALLRSSFAWRQKIETLLSLSTHLTHVLLLAVLLLKLALFAWPHPLVPAVDLVLALGITGLCAPGVFAWATGQRGPPLDTLLQGGMIPTDAHGACAGIFGALGGEFHRTEKLGAAATPLIPQLRTDPAVLGDVALWLASLVALGLALRDGHIFALPVLLIYALSLGWVSALGLWESWLRIFSTARRSSS